MAAGEKYRMFPDNYPFFPIVPAGSADQLVFGW
jgi:hypothetical protein